MALGIIMMCLLIEQGKTSQDADPVLRLLTPGVA